MESSISLCEPSIQYRHGAKFGLYAHCVAPTPGTGDFRRARFTQADRQVEAQPDGRLELCCRYTIQPRATCATHQITLRKGLSVGLSHLRFAQVWMVECEGRTMVARFYDPLYVLDETGAYDIFLQTNGHLGTELVAYTALPSLQGALIPRFVGYFLAMVPAPPGLEDRFPTRSVQVVLLEYIPGETLLALGPGPLDEEKEEEELEDEECEPKRDMRFTFVCDEHKNAVLDAVRLAQHLFILRGIQHMDLMDRNVLLKETSPSHVAFCSSAECALQHSLAAESLVSQLESQSGGEPVDYSKLTPQQLHSLPIAVIDFGAVRLVKHHVRRVNESVNTLVERFVTDGENVPLEPTITAADVENDSRPDSEWWKYKFYRSWRCSKWLPSTCNTKRRKRTMECD